VTLVRRDNPVPQETVMLSIDPLPLNVDLSDADRLKIQGLIEYMDELDEEGKPDIARAILAIDPENLESLVVLAALAESSSEGLVIAREALRIASRRWSLDGPVPPGTDYWDEYASRTFVRALFIYANNLVDVGHGQQALPFFERILELAPSNLLEVHQDIKELQDTARSKF
jgi:tetratricopeptide (TPR) repeat protein